MAFVSSGTQYEVANLQFALHIEDDNEEKIERMTNVISDQFAMYNQYRIISIKDRKQTGSNRIIVLEPSLEPFNQLAAVDTLKKHIQDELAKTNVAIVFEIRLFVSYDEPKL